MTDYRRVYADFDAAAAGYDDFYRMPARIMLFAADAAIDVIELGAGSGTLALTIKNAFPNARLTLMDAAPSMLDIARRSGS